MEKSEIRSAFLRDIDLGMISPKRRMRGIRRRMANPAYRLPKSSAKSSFAAKEEAMTEALVPMSVVANNLSDFFSSF